MKTRCVLRKRALRSEDIYYHPHSGYCSPAGKKHAVEVLGKIRHTRRYNGPQLFLIQFRSNGRFLKVKDYKLYNGKGQSIHFQETEIKK